MTTEPKLIDAEAFEQLWDVRRERKVLYAFLRERGLIAPEPVDPLEAEALAIVEEHYGDIGGMRDNRIYVALAALRRGMELEREKRTVLTREAFQSAWGSANLRWRGASSVPLRLDDLLFDALQEQLK